MEDLQDKIIELMDLFDGEVTTADKIDRPERALEKEAIDDFMKRNPMAEFDTAESGPVGRADGPDDYSIDIDEVGGTSISDLTSDVSKLKAYATRTKPVSYTHLTLPTIYSV